ncbi:hypothetical protein GCM10023196_089830 [Actinoallomurus vinaceus]|uniref:Uncharacterized protein n=1 Tax=Actinoallomurus vinaceus TaxID=1080074 RepID=A0ABP8UQ11_9ACTN
MRSWSWPALTDIHHQRFAPRKDVRLGEPDRAVWPPPPHRPTAAQMERRRRLDPVAAKQINAENEQFRW